MQKHKRSVRLAVLTRKRNAQYAIFLYLPKEAGVLLVFEVIL